MRNRSTIEEVCEQYEDGRMARRAFLRRLGALGVTTAIANVIAQSPLGATKALAAIAGPEDRAWALAVEMAAKAEK